MRKNRSFRPLPLLLLLCLLLGLSACGARPGQDASEQPPADEQTPEATVLTLEDLCGADYQTYLTDTITMQMGNRMDKTPEVVYFPIRDGSPLTDYVAIDESTAFEVDTDGNPVITFPAGTITDQANGEQFFIVPRP